MDIVRNVTPRWKVISRMLTFVFITYLASFLAAESSLVPFSSQQEQNYSSHVGLRTSENDDAMEMEWHISLVKRGVNSSRKESLQEKDSHSVSDHESESWSDQTSSVFETTNTLPSSNIRGKRDASNDVTSGNSTETSSDSQQMTDTTLLETVSESSETTSASIPTTILQSSPPSQESVTTLQSSPPSQEPVTTLQSSPPSQEPVTAPQSPQALTTETITPAVATTATETTVQSTTASTASTKTVCPNISKITIDEIVDGDIAIHWTLEPSEERPQNVCVAVASVKSGACQNHEQCPHPAVSFKTVSNLCHFNEYTVSVFIQCESGLWKNETSSYTTKTSVPSQPTDLEDTDVTNTTIALKWSPPSNPNGDIIQYTVYCELCHSRSSNISETSYILQNLQPYTDYNVSVSAWTSAGESKEQAGPLILRTKDGIPDPPEDLRIREFSNETLILEWSPPSVPKGVIGNFTVYWKESVSPGQYQSYVTSETTRKLENLKPYTNYTLKVSAWTSAGEGRASEEITQQTKEGIPSEPTDLKDTDVTNTTIAIKWSSPGTLHGDITNYTVYLESYHSRSSNTSDTFCTLEDLEPYTDYDVSVSAWTSAGESTSKAGPLHLKTKDGIPDPPENLRIRDFSNKTLALEWSPPSVSKGVIGNFTVYWKESVSPVQYQSYVTSKTTHKLEKLKPYTNYTLKVSAWTSAGEGRASEEITQQTKEGIPGPPLDLKIQNGTDSSLILKWSPPHEKNGVILKYEVSWTHTGDGNRVEKNTNTTNQVFLQIDDLYPYINYTFTVSAFTSAGRGPPSDSKRYQTDVAVPSKPKNVSVSFTGPNILSLSWAKPGQSRGPINGYIVSWQETLQPPKTKQTFDTKSGEVETYEIEKLTPFTNYTVSVASYNINRRKQVLKSEDSTTQAQTSEGIPSAPEDIAIAAFTSTTFSVRWLAPETPNGVVTVYTVYCNSVEEEEVDIAPVNITDTKYTVSGLLPFTKYNLSVSATTIAGEGSKSRWITHKTDVGVPSSPANVSIVNTTDTSIFVEWMKPEFQRGPIDGFHIDCRKISEEVGNVADTEHYHDDFNITVIELCDDYNTISTKRHDDFNATVTICHYQFSGLDPWTNYTIEIKAYNKNQHGVIVQGSPEVINQATLAAVPEPPILYSVDVLSSNSVSIRWMYEGRYPGPTSYAVELQTDDSYNCNSYDKRNITVQVGNGISSITGLTPYTLYHFRIFASTEAGSSSSTNRSPVTTMPDVPGPPVNVKANCHDSPTKASLSWWTPYIQNGLIEEYKIKYRPKSGGYNYKEEVKKINQPKFCIRQEHQFELRDLHPEKDYEIVVMAKTKDVSNYGESERYPQSCVLPAGVPPFPKNDTLPEERETSQEEVKLTFSKNTFSPEMGEIRYYAVIVAFWDKIGIATNGNMTKARDEKLPFWNEFRERNSEFYQATPEYWNPFEGNDYDPLHCQREPGSEQGVLYCTIGWEKNCSSEMSTYCNGPLIPGKRYGVKLRGFTRGGYSETNPIFIETAAIIHKSQVGVIVGLVFLFLLGLLVAGAIFLDRRNNFKTLNRMRNLFRKKEASTEQNVDIDLNRMGASGSSAKAQPMDFKSFLEHVKVMMSDSFLRFSLEYEQIKQNSPKHPCTAAEMEENRMKNRWMNIFPFDHSRVKLLPIDDEPSSDYINANYIPGFSTHREYIATQGPLPSTIDDFWRMVWEQSVTMIVMLTQCVERGKKKCEQYWPADCDNVYYGDLKIQLKSESILSGYCIRIFDLQLGSRQRTVKQMHFTKWPDFGSPESPEDLINFAQAVRDHLPHTNTGPIVVHCSAGVGRTGTFIAVDRLLQHIQLNNDINIYNTVVDMREHRTNMVQTEDQYIYIHKCLRDIISQRLHPRTSIYDDDDDDDLYSNIATQQATEL